MPLLRHQALLLDHAEPTDLPLDGPVFQVRPNDADQTFDNQQHFGLFVALTREGDGVVGAQLFTSVDKVSWHPVAGVATPQDDPSVVQFVQIPAFFPYVKVRTSAHRPTPEERAPTAPAPTAATLPIGTPTPTAAAPTVVVAVPKHTVLARLVSDAPFTLTPA